MFTRIQRLLDVRPALDLRELVTLFGCSQLHDSTQQLLRAFKTRLLESLPAAERGRADLGRPAFLAAAFLLTAKKHRAKVDRVALLSKMGLTRAELGSALEEVAARCEDLLAPAGRARKRGAEDEGDAGAGGGAEEAAGPSGSGRSAGGGAAVRGAKRARRAARGDDAADEDDCSTEAEANQAVAIDDLKLMLIGLGGAPTAGHAGYDADAPEGNKSARHKGSRLKAREAKKPRRPQQQAEGELAEGTGDGSDGTVAQEPCDASGKDGEVEGAGDDWVAAGEGSGGERLRTGSIKRRTAVRARKGATEAVVPS